MIGSVSKGQSASIWKVNVSPKYLPEVVARNMFGENARDNIGPGDLVLLQQLRAEAPDPHGRVAHILEVSSYGPDDKNESDAAWGRHYSYVIHGVVHELEHPFSLEDLGLSKSYSKQGAQSSERIAIEDEAAVSEALGQGT